MSLLVVMHAKSIGLSQVPSQPKGSMHGDTAKVFPFSVYKHDVKL